MKDWKQYQEDAASYFRSLGLGADTDVTVSGVRTSHDIDVLVRSHHVGFDITWIIECKHWKTPISKLHVLALREIVADVGADRGILLSESGFQSGAIEAANLTNVKVTSIREMQKMASETINAMNLRELYDRTFLCKDRYWRIPKQERIKEGLRDEPMGEGYNGSSIIEMCEDILSRAFRGTYPFQGDTILFYMLLGKNRYFDSPSEVVEVVDSFITGLENKLDEYKFSHSNAQQTHPTTPKSGAADG